jgi:hypothetical protein
MRCVSAVQRTVRCWVGVSQPNSVRPRHGGAVGVGVDCRPHENRSPRTSSVTEEDEAARPRQEIARLRSQRSHRASVPPESECQALACEVLRDIPAIGDEQLERSKLSVTSNAKAAQHESVHDQARRADLDDDSEAQPHGESRTASRFCHQEHDRIVVPARRVEARWRSRPRSCFRPPEARSAAGKH